MNYYLVQRTPHLLAYRFIAKAAGEVTVLGASTLRTDAKGWRDRAIDKLVSTPVKTDAAARMLFQGVGLVDAAHAGATRGRVSLVAETPAYWGVCVCFDGNDGAELRVTGPVDLVDESAAIVYLEIERNR